MLIDGQIVFTSATSPGKDVSQGDLASFFDFHTNPELYERAFASMDVLSRTNIDKWGDIRDILVPQVDVNGRKLLFGASEDLRCPDPARANHAEFRVTRRRNLSGGDIGEHCLGRELEIDREARIIVVSGYSQQAQTKGIIGAGAQAFVGKYYQLPMLAEKIRNLLDA